MKAKKSTSTLTLKRNVIANINVPQKQQKDFRDYSSTIPTTMF